MAKYTVDYACGHGSHTIQLFGKSSERDRRLEWEADNRVCPDCYRKQLADADEQAAQVASIRVVCNTVSVHLRVEVIGGIARNQETLASLGLSRRQGRTSFLDMLATRPDWFFGTEIRVNSIDDMTEQARSIGESLTAIGYEFRHDSSPMSVDTALAIRFFHDQAAADQARKDRLAADPKPTCSPLRERIAELEKQTGSKWNGKIYGKQGYWNFYVADIKHTATDAEVIEREENLKLFKAWNERNSDLGKK